MRSRGGGEAVFLDDRGGETWIVMAAGDTATPLIPVREIPATMGGLVRVNETNAMFAAALALVHGIALEVIRRGLSTFATSVEQNPGRYNMIEGLPFSVLLDFAHNPDGVRELCHVVSALPVAGRRLLCSLNIGNRHANHVAAVAAVLAETFDHVVLGCDPKAIELSSDHTGDDPVAAMLTRSREVLLDNGFDEGRITSEADPDEAIRTALAIARPGDLVVVLAEPYEALPVLRDAIRVRSGDASA